MHDGWNVETHNPTILPFRAPEPESSPVEELSQRLLAASGGSAAAPGEPAEESVGPADAPIRRDRCLRAGRG